MLQKVKGAGVLPSGSVYHRWLTPNPQAILIIQHGYTEYAERYVPGHPELTALLETLHLEVWALDMWGHGSSPGPRHVMHVGKAVEDHLRLRRMAAQVGLPIYLFGHSLGGLVTAGSVEADDSNVEGVILSSPAIPAPHSPLLRAFAGVCASIWPSRTAPVRSEPPSCLSRNPEEVKLYEEDPKVIHKGISCLLAATALDCSGKIWAYRTRWVVPILLLHGTADLATSSDISQEFVTGVASSDKQMCIIKGGYHELLRDQCRQEVLKTITEWFERRLPPCAIPE